MQPTEYSPLISDPGTCTVCQDLLTNSKNGAIKKIPECSHFFHNDCIKQWLTNNSNCPKCEKVIKLAPSQKCEMKGNKAYPIMFIIMGIANIILGIYNNDSPEASFLFIIGGIGILAGCLDPLEACIRCLTSKDHLVLDV